MSMSRDRGQMIVDIQRVETRAAAQRLLREEVSAMIAEHPVMEDQARKMLRDNIAYLAFRFPTETAARILDLFETEHPKHGPVSNWPADRQLICPHAREMEICKVCTPPAGEAVPA